METLSGKITLREIFLDNGNWWKFWVKNKALIRVAIIVNVLKLILCRTPLLGHHYYECSNCGHGMKVPHSCKSRFCPPCGKKATDNWMKRAFERLPNVTWQHITFTMPESIWELFWLNRHLFNKIPILAANIIKQTSHKKGVIPGIYLAIHTFGRDLKRNVHLHLSTTIGGLSLDHKKWIAKGWFEHTTLKTRWRYALINLLREEYKAKRLKLPKELKSCRKSYAQFNQWLDHLYQKAWVVHLNEHCKNHKHNTEYLGKYLKRPPLSETRIKAYDGKSIRFEYLDHYSGKEQAMSLNVLEFIARLIVHIPDKYFRNIRYYGFLSNRLSGKLLPIVYKLIGQEKPQSKSYVAWREMILRAFHYDPLRCPECDHLMLLTAVQYSQKIVYEALHKKIAHGFT